MQNDLDSCTTDVRALYKRHCVSSIWFHICFVGCPSFIILFYTCIIIIYFKWFHSQQWPLGWLTSRDSLTRRNINEGPGNPKSHWFANVTICISCVFVVLSSNPMWKTFFHFVGKPAIDVPFFVGGSIYWFMIPDPFGQKMNSRNSSSANSDRQKCRKEVTGSGSDSEKVEVFWRKEKWKAC